MRFYYKTGNIAQLVDFLNFLQDDTDGNFEIINIYKNDINYIYRR